MLDIEAYKEIIATNSQKNAEKFIEMKREARLDGKAFNNNKEVIAEMKRLGVWES